MLESVVVVVVASEVDANDTGEVPDNVCESDVGLSDRDPESETVIGEYFFCKGGLPLLPSTLRTTFAVLITCLEDEEGETSSKSFLLTAVLG